MINLKFTNKAEIKAILRFIYEHTHNIKGSNNQLYNALIRSIISEIEGKLIKAAINNSVKNTIKLKIHEAIALVTIWMDTSQAISSFTDFDYNIIRIKISYLQQKIA